MPSITVGPYNIKEEEDSIIISIEMPWGIDSYRYYFEAKQNCEPQETAQNRSAINVIRFREPLLGKYSELYYTNKERALKESRLACLIFA